MWLTGLKTGGHIGIYKLIPWQIPPSIPMLSTYVKTLSLPTKHAVTNKIPSDLKLQEWLCRRNSSLSRQQDRVWFYSSFLTVWIYTLPLICCIYFARHILVHKDAKYRTTIRLWRLFIFGLRHEALKHVGSPCCILCRLDTNCAGKGAPFCTQHSTKLPDNITIIC
jgi:hypothetical protein